MLSKGCAGAEPSHTPATLTDVVLTANPALGPELLIGVPAYREGAHLPF